MKKLVIIFLLLCTTLSLNLKVVNAEETETPTEASTTEETTSEEKTLEDELLIIEQTEKDPITNEETEIKENDIEEENSEEDLFSKKLEEGNQIDELKNEDIQVLNLDEDIVLEKSLNNENISTYNMTSFNSKLGYNAEIIFDTTFEGTTINKTFTNANDTLTNQGLYDLGIWIFKKYFVGWSETKEYLTTDNAKLYFSNAKISDIYPEGTTEPKTLYAIWVGGTSIAGMSGDIEINYQMTPEQTVTNAGTSISNSGFDSVDVDKNAVYKYDPTIDKYNIVVNTYFTTSKEVALLTYFNPGGILVNSGTWSDGEKQGASYSHIDLHINLDNRLEINNGIIDLEFTSYSFKPSYILTPDYKVLASGLSNLVVQGSPTTQFSTDLKGNNSFILRTTIRRDGNPINNLNATVEQALSGMKLELKNINNIYLPNEEAKKIAENTNPPLVMDGFIDGLAKASSAEFPMYKIHSNDLIIDFKKDTFTPPPTVTPTIVSSETIKIEARTCQDDGYPKEYYWDDALLACVAPISTYKVPPTATNNQTHLFVSILMLSGILLIILNKKNN